MKYRNIKTEVSGRVFDSRKEASRFQILKRRLKAGEIDELTCQPRYKVAVGKGRPSYYVADFQYVEDGVLVVEDVKSPATAKLPLFLLKKKLMWDLHRIEVKVVLDVEV